MDVVKLIPKPAPKLEPLFERSWEVGKYTVTMTVPPLVPKRAEQRLIPVLTWEPRLPKKLTHPEELDYAFGLGGAIEAASNAVCEELDDCGVITNQMTGEMIVYDHRYE